VTGNGSTTQETTSVNDMLGLNLGIVVHLENYFKISLISNVVHAANVLLLTAVIFHLKEYESHRLTKNVIINIGRSSEVFSVI
jgi:hypothetical protein